MSDTYYGLSKIERDLMRFFWNAGRPLTFHEIQAHCIGMNYGWAKTTLHTHLTRLMKKGLLEVGAVEKKRTYYAELTERELIHRYADSFVKDSFGGSIRKLLLSLTYHTKLSRSEVDALKKILDDSVVD